MSMTMSTSSQTSLHLHLACRDLQRSPRGSVMRCTAAKTPYNGFNVIPLLFVDVNAIELDDEVYSPVSQWEARIPLFTPFFPKQILHSSTSSTSVTNFSIFPAHGLPTTLGSLPSYTNLRHTYPDRSICRRSEILSAPLLLGLCGLQKPEEEN